MIGKTCIAIRFTCIVNYQEFSSRLVLAVHSATKIK